MAPLRAMGLIFCLFGFFLRFLFVLGFPPDVSLFCFYFCYFLFK